MSRIGDYDDAQVDQNQRDFNDDVRKVLNYGKYQPQVVTSPPGWTGRKGEGVYVFSGTAGYFYVCTTDNSKTWKIGYSFFL